MMWNYRVVRKKNVLKDSESKKEQTYYIYAIHEAYYDNNGKVGSITQKAISPFGENIEELRHSWLMMAEAFGQSILDYGAIPEPGYNRKEDPDALMLDDRIKKLDAGDTEFIPWEDVKRNLEEKFGPFDEEEYYKETERDRREKERIHKDSFVGVSPLENLVNKIFLDYKEFQKREVDADIS